MEQEIVKLLQILHKIFPDQQTINPYYKIQLDDYPSNYQLYHKLFTHFFTLIFSKHRPMEKAMYITAREDIIASLNLLEVALLRENRKQRRNNEQLYQLLKYRTLKDQLLSSQDISQIIGYKKTQTQRFINHLLDENLLKIVGGTKNKGYLYQLK